MSNQSLARCGVMALSLIAAASCKKAPPPPQESAAPAAPAPAPIAVAFIDLGSHIGANNTVAMPTTSFTPHDTIYAVVSTTGMGSNANLGAKWTYLGSKEIAVNETSQAISPTGPAVTEFHIAKPSAWPAGKYKVEITLNGAAAGTKEFEVKQ